MHMEKTTVKNLALIDKMSTKLSTSPYYYIKIATNLQWYKPCKLKFYNLDH